MRQFLVENKQIKNGLIKLEGKDFRYLRQVLRVRPGDMISVRLPDGSLNNATVAKVDEAARFIILQLCAGTAVDNEKQKTITRGVQAEKAAVSGSAEYWLFQFIPKPQKFELIVRQATECGVAVIVPVIGEYSEKSSVLSLQGAKKERLERIIKEARQQSGSPVDTRVTEALSLEKAIELWGAPADSLAFVLSERDDCSGNLRASVKGAGGLEKIKRAAIAVGSEGGLSPDEVRILEEKALFVPIHFAVNILRCETAALYGIAAVQTEINGFAGQTGQ